LNFLSNNFLLLVYKYIETIKIWGQDKKDKLKIIIFGEKIFFYFSKIFSQKFFFIKFNRYIYPVKVFNKAS